MQLSAIVLAAGSSRRLGRAKQLLSFQGKSLLQRSIDKLLAAGIKQPIIVLGARAESIRNHLLSHYKNPLIVENNYWSKGMASSLHKGLSVIPANSDGVLVCLSDQPLIPESHFVSLIKAYNKSGKLIVSGYNQDVGVPALIPSSYFSELEELAGQKGAKYLLKKYRKKSQIILCPEAAFDVDTEEDYRRMVEMN